MCTCDAETRIGRAGVVNRAGLRGVLRVDAQARAHARETRVKGLELPDRIENDVAAKRTERVDFRRRISGGVDVVFLSHLLEAEAGLVQPAGGGAADIPADERIQRKRRKRLLCQQDAAAGPPFQSVQPFKVRLQPCLVDDVDGRGQLVEPHTVSLRAAVFLHHPRQAEAFERVHKRVGVELLGGENARLFPRARDDERRADHSRHAGGVGDGLRADLAVAGFVVADVVDVQALFLAVLDAR